MDTSELYRRLLMKDPAPEALVRAAVEHLHTSAGAASPSELTLLLDLSRNTGAPAEMLATFAAHPDQNVRRNLVMNPNLDPATRLRVVRAERAVPALRHLAEHSGDPIVLGQLAGRRFVGAKQVGILTALLWNTDLPLEDAARCVLAAHQLLVGGQLDDDEDLRDAVGSAFATFPGLAARVLDQLTVGTLLVRAARTGELDADGWARLERTLVDDVVAGLPAGQALPEQQVQPLADLLFVTCAPAALVRRVADLLLDRNADWSQVAESARRALARLAGACATEEDHAEQLAVAAGDDVDALRLLAARPQPSDEVSWAIATNPAAPGDLVLAAVRRLKVSDRDLRPVFAAHSDPTLQAELCAALGPNGLDLVPAADRLAVLGAALTKYLFDLRNGHGRYGWTGEWPTFIDALDPATLTALPWPLVRTLGVENQPISAWLTGRLTAALTAPGAVRIFASLDATFDGPTCDLFDALAGVSALAS